MPALIGRVFQSRSAGTAGEAAAVISERYWRERYGGDPAALGERFQFARRYLDFTIVGVAAGGFDGVHIDTPADIWVIVEEAFPDEEDRLVRMMGRLAPGATLESASAEVSAVIQRPMTVVTGARGYSNLRTRLDRPLMLLAVLVGLVLLATCANLANLALSGIAARERELALRRAIGASRWRVARQVMVEHLVLSAAGALGGVVLAHWLSGALLAFLPPEQSRALVSLRFAPDGRVLAFAILLGVLTTLVCGLAPAWRATHQAVVPLLKGGGGTESRSRQWTSRGLVVVQAAICVLLLVVSGAFIRTIHHLRTQDTGYIERDVLVADVMPPFEYEETRRDALLGELRTRAAALPGVTVAAFGHTGQLSGRDFRYSVRPTGVPAGADDAQAMEQRVSPGFLLAMGTRIVSGRDISEDDHADALAVALVNGALVRQLAIGGNPIGQRFVKTGGDAHAYLAVEWMLIKESLALLVIGLIIGVPAAVAVARLVSAMLFGLAPGDPTTIAAAIVVLLMTTVLAAYLPARQAAGTNPVVALRED